MVLAAWYDNIPWLPLGVIYVVSTLIVIAIMWSGLRSRRQENRKAGSSK